MSTDDIISICSKVSSRFEKAMEGITYESKGIFNSEMLLVCAMAEHLGVKRVIESGRARGHSTIVLSRYFTYESDFKIDSIEYSKYTEDAIIAMKRLAGNRNLRLLFGDSFDLLPGLVSKEPCVVLIDGPKAKWAILLACIILRNPNVKAVFIHDVHKNSDYRELIMELFPHTLFTDDKKFVESFEALDDECWKQQRMYPQFKGWAPYKRGDKVMLSYSATLAMVFNEPEGIDKVDAFRQYIQDHRTQQVSLLRRVLRKVKAQTKKPYWFVRYYLTKAQIKMRS